MAFAFAHETIELFIIIVEFHKMRRLLSFLLCQFRN